jgi:hypothetical protein
MILVEEHFGRAGHTMTRLLWQARLNAWKTPPGALVKN